MGANMPSLRPAPTPNNSDLPRLRERRSQYDIPAGFIHIRILWNMSIGLYYPVQDFSCRTLTLLFFG